MDENWIPETGAGAYESLKTWGQMSEAEREAIDERTYTQGLVFGTAEDDDRILIEDYISHFAAMGFALGLNRADLLLDEEGKIDEDLDLAQYRVLSGLGHFAGAHSPSVLEEGDGWNEPLGEFLSCSCGAELLGWGQVDPQCTGRPSSAEYLDVFVQHLIDPASDDRESAPSQFGPYVHRAVAYAIASRYFGGPDLKDKVVVRGKAAEQVATTALQAIAEDDRELLTKIRVQLDSDASAADKIANLKRLLG